jgi:hypothetical protein
LIYIDEHIPTHVRKCVPEDLYIITPLYGNVIGIAAHLLVISVKPTSLDSATAGYLLISISAIYEPEPAAAIVVNPAVLESDIS